MTTAWLVARGRYAATIKVRLSDMEERKRREAWEATRDKKKEYKEAMDKQYAEREWWEQDVPAPPPDSNPRASRQPDSEADGSARGAPVTGVTVRNGCNGCNSM